MNKPYDICGWATKFNIKCADGRTIKPGAFDECDGKTVPLVWQHMHDDPKNVLGHALLKKRKDGMYAYCFFNDSREAQDAKIRIKNHDINSFSIYANKLKHNGGDVLHGVIREVSLVLAGANPGALIEFPVLEHGDGSVCEDEAVIYTNAFIESTTPPPMPMPAPMMRPMNYIPAPMPMPTQMTPVLMHAAPAPITKEATTMPERTVQDVFNSMSEEQKNVLYFILGEMLEEFGGSEGGSVKHNVFEGDTPMNTISHDDMKAIMQNLKKAGTLSAAMEDYFADSDTLAHAVFNADGTEQTYGIADIDTLFPEYRNLNNPPDWIQRTVTGLALS